MTGTMRCLWMDSSGYQCPSAALEGAEFCEAHLPLPEAEETARLPFFYRLLRRTAAALLLGMFLLQLYVGLKLLYGW